MASKRKRSTQPQEIEETEEEAENQAVYQAVWNRLTELAEINKITPGLFVAVARAIDIMQRLAESENRARVSFFVHPLSQAKAPPIKAFFHPSLSDDTGEKAVKENEVDPAAVFLLKQMGFLQKDYFVWTIEYYKLSQVGLEMMALLGKTLL